MNAFIIGDMHLPKNKKIDKRVEEIVLLNKERRCDTLVQLGDLFDNYSLSQNDFHEFAGFINTMYSAGGFKQIIIVQGNHELPKHSALSPIAQVINTLYAQSNIKVKYITSVKAISKNVTVIPYSESLPANIPDAHVYLSHLDPFLVNKLSPHATIINGHIHTHKRYHEKRFDLGSVIPLEFEQGYTGKNYYAVLKGTDLSVCEFPTQFKQRTIVLESAADLEKLTIIDDTDTKIIVRSKEISATSLKKYVEASRIEFQTVEAALPIRNDIDQILKTIIETRDIFVNNGIPLALICQAEQKLKYIRGAKCD